MPFLSRPLPVGVPASPPVTPPVAPTLVLPPVPVAPPSPGPAPPPPVPPGLDVSGPALDEHAKGARATATSASAIGPASLRPPIIRRGMARTVGGSPRRFNCLAGWNGDARWSGVIRPGAVRIREGIGALVPFGRVRPLPPLPFPALSAKQDCCLVTRCRQGATRRRRSGAIAFRVRSRCAGWRARRAGGDAVLGRQSPRRRRERHRARRDRGRRGGWPGPATRLPARPGQ